MPGPRADVAQCLDALGDAAADAAQALRGIEPGSGDGKHRTIMSRRERDGLRSVSFWTSQAAWQRLRHLAIENRTTSETLLNRALNLLFIDNGIEAVAPALPAAAPRVNGHE